MNAERTYERDSTRVSPMDRWTESYGGESTGGEGGQALTRA